MAATQHHLITYKKVDGLELSLALYPAQGDASKPVPVLVYAHGGGFVSGDRNLVPAWPIHYARQRGWAFVSFDYLLASPPPLTIAESFADVLDAWAFVVDGRLNAEIAKLDGVASVDPQRTVSVGASAGVLFALLASQLVSPTPRATLSLYGLPDLASPRLTQRLDEPLHPALRPVPPNVTALVTGQPQADGAVQPPKPSAGCHYDAPGLVGIPKELWVKAGNVAKDMGPDDYTRTFAMLSGLSEGTLPGTALGRAQPLTDLSAEVTPESRGKLKVSFSAKDFLAEGPTPPPVLFVHGEADRLVPIGHVNDAAKLLEAKGAKTTLISFPGQDHGFDGLVTPSPEDATWSSKLHQAGDFLDSVLA